MSQMLSIKLKSQNIPLRTCFQRWETIKCHFQKHLSIPAPSTQYDFISICGNESFTIFLYAFILGFLLLPSDKQTDGSCSRSTNHPPAHLSIKIRSSAPSLLHSFPVNMLTLTHRTHISASYFLSAVKLLIDWHKLFSWQGPDCFLPLTPFVGY